MRPSLTHLRHGIALVAVALLSSDSAAAATILVSADLQMAGGVGQLTQAGWQAGEIAPAATTSSESVPLTAAGAASGLTATLVTVGTWNSRGGPTADRGFVAGTSFNGVVSDLWFNREMSFNLQLSGLVTGTSYAIRTWHNDSYELNAGAAAGGGTIEASVSGGTLSSRTNGTVTNLRGTQTDSAFGITTIAFVPTSSIATITFTRSGGDFTGVPLSGIELVTDAIVPEPAAWAIALVGLGGVGVGYRAWRRPASRR
jgi:Tfp pilus assembly protein PilW